MKLIEKIESALEGWANPHPLDDVPQDPSVVSELIKEIRYSLGDELADARVDDIKKRGTTPEQIDNDLTSYLFELEGYVKDHMPNDGSERSRAYNVAYTDLQKLHAFLYFEFSKIYAVSYDEAREEYQRKREEDKDSPF